MSILPLPLIGFFLMTVLVGFVLLGLAVQWRVTAVVGVGLGLCCSQPWP